MNLVISIFLAAIVGALATAFAGTLFRLLEQKSPLLGNDDKAKKLFRRMMFCVWVTSALLCIVLLYQCSPSN
jgi:ABC-type sugar transport system permease subunit